MSMDFVRLIFDGQWRLAFVRILLVDRHDEGPGRHGPHDPGQER